MIELMVAMVLGLVVVGAVLAVFLANSATVRTVGGVAQVQETTRFVAEMFAGDLRQAGYRHCSGLNMKAATPAATMPYVTALSLPPGMTQLTSGVVQSSSFIQGYECAGSTCSPTLPSTIAGLGAIPSAGTAANQRVPNTDVIIIRYLAGDGVPLFGHMAAPDKPVPIDPAKAGWTEATPGGVVSFLSQWILIGDCRGAEIFAPTNFAVASGGIMHDVTRNNSASLRKAYRADGYTRAYLLPRDMVSRAYYVAYRQHEGRLVASLMRLENGSAQAVVDGVERFDLSYRFSDSVGTQMGSASAVETADAWGEVEAIDTSMLLASVSNALTESMNVTYAGTTVTPPSSDLQLRRSISFTTRIRNPRGKS